MSQIDVRMKENLPYGSCPFMIKIMPPALTMLVVIDIWFAYHNIKLHSWYALLAFFPIITLIFELQLLIRFIIWLMD